ncbi:MAG: TonB-dependent receptor [Bryobacterales bacterium]|nr:TonB-dependent receptor [Bryobacterales bacterium]
MDKIAILAMLCPCVLPAQILLQGRILTPNADPIAGARLRATAATATIAATAGPQGRFSLSLPGTATYEMVIEREGYYPLQTQIDVTGSSEEITFTLVPVRELRESLDVTTNPLTVDIDSTAARRTLDDRQIINVPYPNTNDFRSALRIVPGVIRDNRGGLHINGAGEEQILYTLNSFQVNDPLSGRFDTRLNVESVHNVEITGGNLPAEFGKGSAGALAVRTHIGDNQLRYSATNFMPGFENRKGWIVGDWAPRLTFAGPLRKGRAWFSNSLDLQYVQTVIRDLPKGQDRYSSMRYGNLLHTQLNLGRSHILHAGFLANLWNAPRTGLTALDPLETTIDRRTRQWFFHIRDHVSIEGGFVAEIGFASNRTFGREIPQGPNLLAFTPEGKRGNFFVDGIRHGARDQILWNNYLPSFTKLGTHQWKTGVDWNRVQYNQNVHRTGYENYSDAGRLVTRTLFAGAGTLERSNHEFAAYLQDSWRIKPRLLIETGIRADWDSLLRIWSPAPRLAMAWSPTSLPNTKLYGGISRIFDASSVRLFTRQMDQYTLTTYFAPEGHATRTNALSIFSIPGVPLHRPRYYNATAGVEHYWPGRLALRAEFLNRRGAGGFTYRNAYTTPELPPPAWALARNASFVDAVYTLDNTRRDSYRAISFSVRQNIRRQYEWLVSYTRSRALSNAVIDVNIDDPIIVTSNTGPMPWDAPHRLMSWAYLPTPFRNWSIAYLLDARNGFPYSTRLEDGRISGNVNALRFPFFFELNLHIERRFVFRGHRWALRLGANNITNRINPETVNNTVTSARYGQFFGGNGRATNIRIRWLGRQ